MMPSVQRPIALRARYLFPINSPCLRDSAIVVSQGEILAVGSASRIKRQFDLPLLDLGDVALLPALINAHTHLEFSHLAKPLGRPGMAFTNWIREVMSERRDRTDAIADVTGRVLQGLRELIETGTAAVGEIATHTYIPDDAAVDQLGILGTAEKPSSFQQELHKHPQVTAFYELIGLSTERMRIAQEVATANCTTGKQPSFWQTALSPHAPYSCHLELLRWACEKSATDKFPVAMHLAETREELKLLQNGMGEFRHLLEEFGVWSKESFPGNRKILDYLEILAKADRALVVHGNFLNSSEIAFLASRRRQMSVVFCPRTHAFFAHPRYPLQAMLQAGVRIALGTDSRASNPDLSVWQEARLVAKQFPEIHPERILAMTTIHGAEALGADHHFGSLETGKRACLNYLPLPHTSPRLTAQDLLEQADVPRPLALSTAPFEN